MKMMVKNFRKMKMFHDIIVIRYFHFFPCKYRKSSEMKKKKRKNYKQQQVI